MNIPSSILTDIPFSEKIRKKKPFRKCNILYFNKMNHEESSKFAKFAKFALVRKTILLNQNIV